MKKARSSNASNSQRVSLAQIVSLGPEAGVRLWEEKGNPEVTTEQFIVTLLRNLPPSAKITPWLDFLAFGRKPSETKRIIQEQKGGGACAHVFKPFEPAYQCRTCGVDPTCVLCMDCFKLSDHAGHEILMTRAGGGGCCDCGDASSWDMKGACSRHNGQAGKEKPLPPQIDKRARPVVEFMIEIVSRGISGVCPEGRTDAKGEGGAVGSVHLAFEHIVNADKSKPLDSDNLHFTFLNDDSYHSFENVIHILVKAVCVGLPNINDKRMMAFQLANAVNGRGRALIKVGSLNQANECLKAIQQNPRTKLDVSVEKMGPNDCMITMGRLAEIVDWLTDLCSMSNALRDSQCDMLLRRYSIPEIPSPGTHGIQQGDWVIANGKQGIVATGIRRPPGSMSIESAYVSVRYLDDDSKGTRVVVKMEELKVSSLRKPPKPGINLTQSIGSLWRKDNGLPQNPVLQVIGTIPDGLLPGHHRVYVISDGKHATLADFSHCARAPTSYEIVKLTKWQRIWDFEKQCILVSDYEVVRTSFPVVIGRPKTLVCAAGDKAEGLSPHRLDMMFQYNLSIYFENWERLTPWFFRLFGNMAFKKSFTVTFATYYGDLLEESAHLGGAVQASFLSYGVQVLTIPSMTPIVARDFGLLRTMIGSIQNQVVSSLRRFSDTQPPGSQVSPVPAWLDLIPVPSALTAQKVGALDRLLTTVRIIVRDIEYVCRNQGSCELFFTGNCSLLQQWLGLLVLFEGMDINYRAAREHVQFEQKTWKTAFSLSFRLSSISHEILKSFREAMDKGEISDKQAARILQICISALRAAKTSDPSAATPDAKSGGGFGKVGLVLPRSKHTKVVEADVHGEGPDALSFHAPARRLCVRLLGILLRKIPLNNRAMSPLFSSVPLHEDRMKKPRSFPSDQKKSLSLSAESPMPKLKRGDRVEIWWHYMENWVPASVLEVRPAEGDMGWDEMQKAIKVQYDDGEICWEPVVHDSKAQSDRNGEGDDGEDVSPKGRMLVVRKPRFVSVGVPAIAEAIEPMLKSVAGLFHVNAQLWVRNGVAMLSQALNYTHISSTYTGMYLADINAFQLGTCILGPDAVVALLAHHSRLYALLQLSPLVKSYPGAQGHGGDDAERLGDEELRSVAELKVVKSWGDKLSEVAFAFLLFLAHSITERRITGIGSGADTLRREIVHILLLKPRTHSEVAELVDQDVKDAHPEEFEKVLREVATLNSDPSSVSASGKWEVKAEAARAVFNPYSVMYRTEDRQVAEERYKQIISSSMKKKKMSHGQASPSSPELPPATEPYPPVVSYPPLLPSFRGMYDMYSSALVARIIFQALAAALKAGGKGNEEPEKNEGELGEVGFGLALHIISLALNDASEGHLRDSPEVLKGFFQNMCLLRVAPDGSSQSILGLLCALRSVASTRSGIIKESVGLMAWAIKNCRRLDPTGQAGKIAGGDEEEKSKTGGKKMSKRERRLAAAKARKMKIMKKMKAQRSKFAEENKQAIKEDQDKTKAKGDGILSLTCIVCRTDNSSQPLGLVAHFQDSAVLGMSSDVKGRGNQDRKGETRNGDGGGRGLLAKFCGHAMHLMCRDTYYSSLVLKEINHQHYTGLNAIELQKGEFVCPLCEAPANDLVPIPDIPGETSAECTVANRQARAQIRDRILQMAEEKEDKSNLPIADSLAYTARSLDMAYRYTPRGSGSRVHIAQALKPREIMGLSCFLSVAAHATDHNPRACTPDSQLSSCAKEARIAQKLLKSLGTLAEAKDDRQSLAHLPVDVDAFQLVTMAAMRRTRGELKPAEYKELRDAAYIIRLTQALAHALVLSPKGVKAPPIPTGLRPLAAIAINHGIAQGGDFNLESMNRYMLPFLRQVAVIESASHYLESALNSDSKIGKGAAKTMGSKAEASGSLQAEINTLTQDLGLSTMEDISSLHKGKMLIAIDSWLATAKAGEQKSKMPFLRTIDVPRLINLPETYNQLFMALKDGGKSLKIGDSNGSVSMETESSTSRMDEYRESPAVCLLTGKILEVGNGNLSRHTASLSPNAGVFIVLKSTRVLLISNGYGIGYGSPYVDSHGEMDLELRRGHMLYLDTVRGTGIVCIGSVPAKPS
uniref:E3 ubiquitin-protein ligase n=1 Tax=Lotharella globosa TaxID=91324 RepID=A0A6V3IVK9_9EUKA